MEVETEDVRIEESSAQSPEVSVEEQRAEKYYEKAQQSAPEETSLHSSTSEVPIPSEGSSLGSPDNVNSNANSNIGSESRQMEEETTGKCNESKIDNNNKRTSVKGVTEDSSSTDDEVEVTSPESTGSSESSDSDSSRGDQACGALGKNKKNLRINVDSIESFNSFQYWREPLPEIDVDSVVDDSRKAVPTSSDGNSDDDEDSDERPPALQLSEDSLSESENEPQIYTANVSTMCEVQEMVTNIGSMHVLGQHVDHKTLEVVNGIVEG